ncbi:hypothetical protein [uncultured Bacteroides sp.]|uniref:hypothetical protein n=1 Tax=uncultured Bacteroides sp. TaxID=162156 RepID=UPI002AAC3854|nr:hypothetical protein [uncultured Bacteroides sp.]
MDYTKSPKRDIILNSLSPYEPGMQRYLSLLKDLQSLMTNAEDKNEACISIELVAELMMLQEELYQKAVKKNKEEAN